MTGPDRQCARCHGPAALTAYWGDDLCGDCARWCVAFLDDLGRWPPVPWDAADDAVLHGETAP